MNARPPRRPSPRAPTRGRVPQRAVPVGYLTFVLILCLASPAAATLPSSYYNQPGQKHNNDCVEYKGDSAPLRYPDFSETGFLMKSNMGFPPKGDFACPPLKGEKNRIRFDAHDALRIKGVKGRLYFARGGSGYIDPENVKYGWIWSGDITGKPSVKPPMNSKNTRLRNGSKCRASSVGATQGHYRLKVISIPTAMHVVKRKKVPGAKKRRKVPGASWRAYGDPANDQRTPKEVVNGVVKGPHDQGPGPPGGRHYTYLLWNWPNVENGGIVRSPVMPKQVFHRCDVKPIRSYSTTRPGLKRNGWVDGVYGKMFSGGRWLYGWVVHSHDFYDDKEGAIPHFEAL